MTPANVPPFPNLAGAEFMVLTTYRASGIAVPTAVWFAEADGKLYVTTRELAGKAKRIRNMPRVSVAPSDRVGTVLGEAQPALARILAPDEFGPADAALERKYGAQYTGVVRSPAAAAEQFGARIYLEIRPEG